VCVVAALAGCGRGPGLIATSPAAARAAAASRGPPRNGLEVVAWMRRAYPSRELRSLTFTVRSVRYANDTTPAESRVSALLPGRIRVEAIPVTSRTGTVRDRQRLAVFRAGHRVTRVDRVDLRTLLAYDVFAQGVDTTIMWLDSARVRFGLVRRDDFDGRPVWVVGADDGDMNSAQFWVDAERWHVVRVIQREPRLPAIMSDVRFTDFTELLGVPVPTRMEVWREGKLFEQQSYSDFTVNPPLSRRAFDLSKWYATSLSN